MQALRCITPQLCESHEHLPECIRTSMTKATPANKQYGSSSLSSVTVLDAVNSSNSEDISDYDNNSDSEILGGLQECEKQQQDDEFTSHAGSSNVTGSESGSSTNATSLLEVLKLKDHLI